MISNLGSDSPIKIIETLQSVWNFGLLSTPTLTGLDIACAGGWSLWGPLSFNLHILTFAVLTKNGLKRSFYRFFLILRERWNRRSRLKFFSWQVIKIKFRMITKKICSRFRDSVSQKSILRHLALQRLPGSVGVKIGGKGQSFESEFVKSGFWTWTVA